MPGFNQHQLAYRARNANAATIWVGNQIIGFAQATTHTFDFGTETLYGIGTAMPQEIQQLRVAPQITIDSFALTSRGLADLGYPSNLSSILSNTQFTISVQTDVDTTPGNNTHTAHAWFTYVACTAVSFNENIPTNRPITDAITFQAMDVLDETGQSILSVPGANQNAYQALPPTGNPIGGLGLPNPANLGISI
jgi:hypothetical protein